MVIIDVFLVFNEANGFPTFSKVFKDHRAELIWMNFLYGGLMTKIFFNRTVNLAAKEVWGFSGYLSIMFLVGLLGYLIPEEPHNLVHLAIMFIGGYVAYRIWPKYVMDAKG